MSEGAFVGAIAWGVAAYIYGSMPVWHAALLGLGFLIGWVLWDVLIAVVSGD